MVENVQDVLLALQLSCCFFVGLFSIFPT